MIHGKTKVGMHVTHHLTPFAHLLWVPTGNGQMGRRQTSRNAYQTLQRDHPVTRMVLGTWLIENYENPPVRAANTLPSGNTLIKCSDPLDGFEPIQLHA
jgi:hypothetical protein